MKLNELNFKVITGTENRNRAIQEALFEKGGKWQNIKTNDTQLLDAMYLAYAPKKGLSYGLSIENFIESDFSEVTFNQALDLIKQVKPENKGEWVEYDIDEDLYTKIEGKKWSINRLIEIIRGNEKIKAFGGIQYIEPKSGIKSNFVGSPLITFQHGIFYDYSLGDCLPVYPHKIKFWVEN